MSTGRRLASNAGYLASLTAANYLLGLLIFPFLSRVLSVDAFGLVGFSMAFVVLFQVLVEYGFMITATAQVAASQTNPARIATTISTTMLAKALLVAIASLSFAVVSVAVPIIRENVTMVALFLVSAILTALLPDFYFRGIERMRSIAVRAVISKLLALILIVLLVRGDDQLVLVPISLALGNALAVALAFLAVYRSGVILPRPSLRQAALSLKAGFGFFASRAAAAINQASGAFVLGLQFAPASPAVGQFTGASRIASAGELAVVPISDAIFPHMVRTRDFRVFWRVYLVGLALWFTGCLGVFLFAVPLCVFILGPAYEPAGPLLQILAVGVFIAYSSNMFGYVSLTPLGLAHHANLALILASIGALLAYLTLWAASFISPVSVCIVMVGAQFCIFAYRATALTYGLHRRSRS